MQKSDRNITINLFIDQVLVNHDLLYPLCSLVLSLVLLSGKNVLPQWAQSNSQKRQSIVKRYSI